MLTSQSFFHIQQYVQVSSGLNHYFLSQPARQKDVQTDRQTDRQTETHTYGHEYSIAAVDKPQL